MNVNPANAPPGWKAEWSQQYARYFYINLSTNESTWNLPTASLPPVQHQQSLQRKPVPGQPSPTQVQMPVAVKQGIYVEAYPTPPPQVTTGYFPPAPSPHKSPQNQYAQAPVVQQQQNPHALPQQQQRQYNQYQANLQQFSPATNHSQSPASSQIPQLQNQYPQQQRNFITPATSPNSGIVPQYPQQALQILSPPTTPSTQGSQLANDHIASPQHQSQIYALPSTNIVGNFVPQRQGPSPSYPRQPKNFVQPQQQGHAFIQPQQQVTHLAQPSAQYQQQGVHPQQVQTQAQQQQQQQQGKRSSVMGGSMINKMSSKFTQLQKGVAGPPTAAHPNGKPADWKKWGKRAAIGVAGIGALALGVDAAGDMFSGAEGLAGGDWSGGGDFGGGGGDLTGFEGSGDAAGAMDAQTMVEANNAQLEMAGIGQDNASMLLDPAGTEYTWTGNAEATQNAASLI
ncbi:hypothetical protein HBI56_131500 [Parastagonospora nodorum]|nr:hypothetical protein HBH53_218310 [Parastagonospora nodorum]KAH3996627.1 hypothetical protein HBI10_153420 [Parastagonospora nodorum]KAH4012578.1 hypothetical protein HBI13_188110 [Parastagonospora nodorum]KAH4029586.1 hypothetical protein HBI09_135230 [Parastagonospora nodorum]KAH4047519.1 hypothetical protein HBH49_166270 [Parastagonospora nodorum]